MADMDMETDVAIVGGGVTGCYCAYRLARSNPSLRVCLFEQSKRIGGRLWSVGTSDPGGLTLELGGMVFTDTQKNVFNLVKEELKLCYEEVEYLAGYQYLRGKSLQYSDYQCASKVPYQLEMREKLKTPGEILIQAMNDIAPKLKNQWPLNTGNPDHGPADTVTYLRQESYGGRFLYQWGFWNILSQVVSNEAYDMLLKSLGSSSTFRNANAFDAIWTILQEIAHEKVFRLTNGFEELPHELFRRSADVVKLHQNKRLLELSSTFNSMILHMVNSEGEKFKVKAGSVILAIPRYSLDEIRIDESISFGEDYETSRESVMRVFASKLFLAFDEPWWDNSQYGPGNLSPNQIAIAHTDLPMRSCHYFGSSENAKKSVIMASYADGVAASFWSGLINQEFCEIFATDWLDKPKAHLCASKQMVDSARQQLQAMHRDIEVPTPTGAAFIDWSKYPHSTAWHAWKPYVKSWEMVRMARQPNRELPVFVCGEAFAQPHGWVESAINTAEVILEEHYGLPRPKWVSADYQFQQ